MQYFEQLIRQVPLEWFVFIGTFFEELVSPIPSVLIMVPAGIAAQAQGSPLWYLVWLAVLAATGRMLAAAILYYLADKAEDIVFTKGRRFLGVSHKDIESFGSKLSAKHPVRSWWTLFALSALPFLPTATLSLASGFVKIRFKTFLTSNFLGSILNGLFYLYIGYAGLETAKLLGKLELVGQIAFAAGIVALLGWVFYRRLKRRR